MADILVNLRHSPYGSSLARAAIDTALAAAAFEQAVTLLFSGPGVLNLLPEQDSTGIGSRNLGRVLASLPLYDIETLYVDADAVSRYNLDVHLLPPAAKLLDRDGIRQLLLGSDHLLGF